MEGFGSVDSGKGVIHIVFISNELQDTIKFIP